MHTADNARATSSLMWTTTRLCVVFAGWSAQAAETDNRAAAGCAVWLRRAGRCLWDHSRWFSGIRPESLLLEGSSAHGASCKPPEPATVVGLAALAGSQGAAEHSALLQHERPPQDPRTQAGTAAALLRQLQTEATELRERCAPHTDGALRRALDFLAADLAALLADRPTGPDGPSGPGGRPGPNGEREFGFRLVAPVG